jgi:hypothetical protein
LDPYLSIVTFARNDDYQGSMFERMQFAINTLIEQMRKYKLNWELILVDWNPPPERPLIKDVISWANIDGRFDIRNIIVPHHIHKKNRYSERLNILPVAARNVGIRRARGEFVLPTNSDIFFSDKLVNFLAKESLSSKYFYRANRHDVHMDVLKCKTYEEQFDFCERNVIRVYKKTGNSPHKLPEHPALHTNGGDFILMSREAWHALNGWPNLNSLGLFSDGLLCYMAYASGLVEKVLEDSMSVYHIDHENRWRQSRRIPENRFVRYIMERYYGRYHRFFRHFVPRKLNEFDYRHLRVEYRKAVIDILTGNRSYKYNNDNWGMPDLELEEHWIHS